MWGALVGALIQVVGTLVGKVLIALGVGYVTYKGLDVSLSWAKSEVLTLLGGVGGTTVQVMGTLNVFAFVRMVFSAIAMRMTFEGVSAGAKTAMRIKS